MQNRARTNPDRPFDYSRAAKIVFGVMPLARRIDELFFDEAQLRRSGDQVAAAGAARLLRLAMLHLAAAPAGDPRQFARKKRALADDRIVASGHASVGVEMIRAGIEADRTNLNIAADLASADLGTGPSPSMMAYYADQATGASFLSALSDNEGLRHDHAYLLARGEAAMAQRLAERWTLDLVRPTSRPTSTLNEARLKTALIESVTVGQPTLAAMLTTAAALERARWDVGPVTVVLAPWTTFPGEAERCAHYEALPDPTDVEAWIEIAEQRYADLDTLRRRGDFSRAAGCLNVIIDFGLMVAAIPARHEAEVTRKLEFLAALRSEMGGNHALAIAMLDAAIKVECGRWDILLVDDAHGMPRARS